MKNQSTAIAYTTAATIFTTPLIIFSSLLATQTTFAESVNVDDEGSLQLSITANRRSQAIDKTLASVTVITRKKIEQSQTQDLVDLLRQQRGVSIARTGGVGSQTSLFMRGTESDHVLVLLDGVRITAATTGFDWSQISLDQVERIEIVRGPRAALYGSDAIGGVVEITSRKNARPYVSITAGSYGTGKFSTGFSDGDDKNHVSLNLSREVSEGFSAQNSNGFGFDPDLDGHKKSSVALSFSRQLSQKIKAGIDILQAENEIDIDYGHNRAELETISAYLQSDVSDRWSQKINISHAKNEVVGSSSFLTKRNEFNWQNNITLSDSTALMLGANYRRDEGKTSTVNEEIINKAVYANVNKKHGALNLDFTARYDKHSLAGGKTTGQIALGYDLSRNTTAFTSYGSAFRAPNINDLYSPGLQRWDYDPVTQGYVPAFDDLGNPIINYKGNLNLKPEQSKTFEVGVKSHLKKNQSLEASIFYTEVSDLINNSGVDYQSINVDSATLKGFELGYSGRKNKLDWGIDLTLLRTKDNTTGSRLLRRPNEKLALNLGYKVSDKTRLSMDATFVGSRSDYGAELPSYSLLNLSMNQKLDKHSSLGLRIENVANEDYELAYGYNTPKRGAYLTFSYR